MSDEVSAEEAQGMLDRDRVAREVYGVGGGFDGARLARTIITQARELDVLRAQLAPLLAVHDALVAAAALPGAGASPDEMVAAVRAQGAEAMRAGIVAAERERCARGRAVRGEDPRGRCVMDADQRTRLRALCSVDADPVRVHRTDLADVLDALDAAERDLDVMRRQQAPLLASHDALCRAAGLPGAGASAEEMVAAVRAKARREARDAALRECLDIAESELRRYNSRERDVKLTLEERGVAWERAAAVEAIVDEIRDLPLLGDVEVSRG